jgi:hypothetical protein
MRFVYGNFTFEENEVALLGWFRERIPGPRGGDMVERVTLQVMVDQLQTGAAANVARFRQFDQYSANLQQCGFVDEAGNKTMVWLDPSTSLSGLRLLQPPSIVPQDEVEFATHLSIPIGFQMDSLLAGGDQILDYEESITFEDEGPTRIVPVETDTGDLEFYQTCAKPARFITQAGFAVGRDAPPAPNGPRIDAVMIQRVRGRVTPVKQGLRFIGYRIEWRYVFVVQEELDFLPLLR